ncbi:hypothetical protein NX059_012055 [Plenodomus lindquistii]|nr:hypothetical protein NX059_012055 [Plenodomus lindquistii]
MSHPSHQPSDASLTDLEKNLEIQEKDSHSSLHDGQIPVPPLHQDAPNASEQTASAAPIKPNHNFTDWNGPNDPDNPHNWPAWKSAYHIIIPALFGFAVTFGTSVYSPALPDIMRDFGVSRTVAIIGLTVYTVGLALGPIITAPLSERYGRKIIYVVHSPIFMLFTLGAGFSKNYAGMCICRFLAGAAGSPGLAVGAGTNADLFPPHKRAVTTSLFLMAPFAGPALGPVVGGFVAQYKTWQWTQWSMLFVTLAIFLASLPMKETFKPIILARRAKKAGVPLPPKPPGPPIVKDVLNRLTTPLHLLFTEPVVLFFSLYNAFTFGLMFLFFAAFPFIFQRPPYSFSISQTGLTFISIGIGVLLGGLTSIAIDRTLYQRQYRKVLSEGKSSVEPEHRLYTAMVGSFGIVAGLFWLGWCADGGVHWAATLLAAIVFGWGNVGVFASSALYLTDVYGFQNGASAMAANGIARYTLGGVFPLFTVQMYQALGIGWATSLLGFLALGMMPIPFLFFKYGRAIRAKSSYPVAM